MTASPVVPHSRDRGFDRDSINRTTWNFATTGRLIFGCGAVREIGPATKRLGCERVLVVTDAPLVRAGIVDRAAASLKTADLKFEIFDGGEPEPSLDVAAQAVAAARRFAPDAIVGLGGGSNMDLAKITALIYTHGGEFADYFGWNNVPGPVCPIIGVPTTAGTGSEVSHAAVLSDHANHIKVSTLSPYLRPVLAVVDPELTLTCPPQATADSGIDALTHAVEAYVATDFRDLNVPLGDIAAYEGKNSLTDCLAERAIQLIGRHLVTAVNDPVNVAAREGMALAATLAGMAFSNGGVALVHAMEYPLGGALHCSHGAGNGLLLPHVMRFNLPVRTAAMANIARLLGEDTTGLSEHEAAERAIAAVCGLQLAIGIPQRIRDLGGTVEQLPGFAKKAFAIKRLMTLTPRAPSEAEILAIYRGAY